MSITYNLKELVQAVDYILSHSKTKIFLFNAEMGTGKTTLIKALVKKIGSQEEVSSPTFSLVNEYESISDTIYHFDLYRIENSSELYDFGIEMYLEKDAYIFVEWPELLKPILFEDYTEIFIHVDENQNRVLELKNSI